MSGYMLVPVERVPEEFNAGFSLYAAAWPLLERYPGSNFQSGLFGTWMFAQWARGADGKTDPADKPGDMYSDIEGGLGWWRDTRFATTTPKFIMGGVAPDFAAWANGPGAGKGRDWDEPLGKYAIAQLSPWVVWPPDGLNLAQGTCGELFGYGYVPLPLVPATPASAERPIAKGDQCWTLFLNTANFKGPLCFFTPNFWAENLAARPELAGKLLDTRASDPNKAFQMETQWIPAAIAAPMTDGATYARVAPTTFPVDAEGRTVVLHRLTSYSAAAITDAVRAWRRAERCVRCARHVRAEVREGRRVDLGALRGRHRARRPRRPSLEAVRNADRARSDELRLSLEHGSREAPRRRAWRTRAVARVLPARWEA
jgi:hypothetical protein